MYKQLGMSKKMLENPVWDALSFLENGTFKNENADIPSGHTPTNRRMLLFRQL